MQATKTAIPVDQYMRTNVPHIFAAGDVNGQAKLVQFARGEGHIAAQNAVEGPRHQARYRIVPSASFTDPEYGQVGLTEAQAQAARTNVHDIVTATADYEHLLRPVADGRPNGFCKLIADRRDHTILGGRDGRPDDLPRPRHRAVPEGLEPPGPGQLTGHAPG